jgi:hypothetical protein
MPVTERRYGADKTYVPITMEGNIMKKFALLTLAVLAMPLAAQAQGVVRGAEEGAAAGNRAAGPVGGAVGGIVGNPIGFARSTRQGRCDCRR